MILSLNDDDNEDDNNDDNEDDRDEMIVYQTMMIRRCVKWLSPCEKFSSHQ